MNDAKKVVPAHVTMVKEIMLRCKHIIASRNPRLRLLVLDTIRHTCTALRSHQGMCVLARQGIIAVIYLFVNVILTPLLNIDMSYS